MQRDLTHNLLAPYYPHRKVGMTPPPTLLSHIAYDFLFVKLRGPQTPSCAPLSYFSEVVNLCAPGQMCKDNPVTLSTHTPSNSRDVHHMIPVTNHLSPP